MIKIVTENGTLIEGPWKDDEGLHHDNVRLTNPKGERSELSWDILSALLDAGRTEGRFAYRGEPLSAQNAAEAVARLQRRIGADFAAQSLETVSLTRGPNAQYTINSVFGVDICERRESMLDILRVVLDTQDSYFREEKGIEL